MSIVLNHKTKMMLQAFKDQGEPKPSPDTYNKFTSMLVASPPLVKQLNETTESGYLAKIAVKPLVNIGAQYNPPGARNTKGEDIGRSIYLNQKKLAEASGDEIAMQAFILGHELKHAQNAPHLEAREKTFRQSVEKLAQSPGNRDYTQLIKERTAGNRKDEASSHIAGWNAAMAYEKHHNPKITPEDLAKKLSLSSGKYGSCFYDQATGKMHPNIRFEKDGSIQPTASNVEALGKNFVDLPPSVIGLGAARSDYKNYYAASALSWVAYAEYMHQPKHQAGTYASVDMKALGINQKDIQAVGIQLKTNNVDTAKLTIVDTSTKNAPNTLHFYDGHKVPPGKPEVTPGLPNTKQHLQNTPILPIDPPDMRPLWHNQLINNTEVVEQTLPSQNITENITEANQPEQLAQNTSASPVVAPVVSPVSLQSESGGDDGLEDTKAPSLTTASTTAPESTNALSKADTAQTEQAPQLTQDNHAPSVGGQAKSGASSNADTDPQPLVKARTPDKQHLLDNISPDAASAMQTLINLQHKLFAADKRGEEEKAEKIKLILANRAKGLPDDTPATPSPEVASKEGSKDAPQAGDKSSSQQAKNDPTINGEGKEAGAQDTTQIAANKAENPNAVFDRAFARGQEATQQDRIDNPQQGRALKLS